MNKENTCPRCGSEDVQRLETYHYTEGDTVVVTQCDKCGHTFDQHYESVYKYTTEEK